MRKKLISLILCVALTACGMSIEEYNARVKYCKDNNMVASTEYRGIPDKSVRDVRCVDSNGSTFSSKSADG